MSSLNIVERIYEYEVQERADVQMECSEDAIGIEWIRVEDNGCLSTQFGESK